MTGTCAFHPRREAGDLGLCGACLEDLEDRPSGLPIVRKKKARS